MFKIGQEYNRQSDLHDVYGGNRQSGIAPSATHPIVFLFTSPTGEHYGYEDGWTPANEFLYTGEGNGGDMTMARGNKAIRDHEEQGKTLHLFERSGHGSYIYQGELRYVDYEVRQMPDVNGMKRAAFVFRLKKVGS